MWKPKWKRSTQKYEKVCPDWWTPLWAVAASCIRVSLFIKTGSIKHLPTSAQPRTSFKFVKILKNGDYETADAWMRNFATKQSCIHNVYRADYIYLGSKVFCVNLGNLQMQPQQKVSYFNSGVSVSFIIIHNIREGCVCWYFRPILKLFIHLSAAWIFWFLWISHIKHRLVLKTPAKK